MLTLPQHLLAAANSTVMCSGVILLAELGSNGRGIGGQGVVLTHFFVGTEGACGASGPCAAAHSCLPLVKVAIWALMTKPPSHPGAANSVVMSSALVSVTEMGSNGRGVGGQGVVLAHFCIATEGATGAIFPAGHCRLPLMGMPIWALITRPPKLSAFCQIAKVGILGRMPLALQSGAEVADVWASGLVCITVYQHAWPAQPDYT